MKSGCAICISITIRSMCVAMSNTCASYRLFLPAANSIVCTISPPSSVVTTARIFTKICGRRMSLAPRICWNYNGSGQRDRGWKEIDIFVANSRTDLTPEISGIVPRAPGANLQPDFSIVLPVDQVRGRYVILKAKSLWSPSNFAGLAEIQVIGYE